MKKYLDLQITRERKCETHHCFPRILKSHHKCITSVIMINLITFTIYFLLLSEAPTYVRLTDISQVNPDKHSCHVRVAGLPIEAHRIPVLEFKSPVRGEDNIIFLHTTCVAMNESTLGDVTHELRMTYQQVCAVESAARMNPRSKVYLFYTCPLDSDSLNKSSVLIRRLFEYTNIHIWYQTLEDFFRDTPLEKLYRCGRMQKSKYPIIHTSDVLRYLALWKYGGIYLDLDFIITKSLDGLGKNFAGAESENFIANGALGMSVGGIGKQVADACLKDLRTHFRGDMWARNGPMVITRVMQRKICREKKTSLMTQAKCGGFQVHNASVLYAVRTWEWKHFYTEKNSEITMAKVENSYAVHLWNSMEMLEKKRKLGRQKNITSKSISPGSKQPVALLREQYCPLVYSYTVADSLKIIVDFV